MEEQEADTLVRHEPMKKQRGKKEKEKRRVHSLKSKAGQDSRRTPSYSCGRRRNPTTQVASRSISYHRNAAGSAISIPLPALMVSCFLPRWQLIA